MLKLNKNLSLTGKILVVLGVLFFSIQVPVSSAADSNQLNCQFDSDIKSLDSLQKNSSLEYLEKIKIELGIRKKILGGIINCSVQEAQILKTKLSETVIKDAGAIALKSEIDTEIDQAIEFYNSQARTISDLGIFGSKSLAKKLLEWRSTNYSNLVARTVNLISWNNSQEVLGLAEKRLDGIKAVILNLKEVDPKLESLMKTAGDNLKKAEGINEQARRAIINSEQVDKQLSMVKDSLQIIADVYNNFFEISDTLSSNSNK